MDVPKFLDGANGSPRDAVHLLFVGEKVKATHAAAAPALTTEESHKPYRVLELESLVRMKLTSFRR